MKSPNNVFRGMMKGPVCISTLRYSTFQTRYPHRNFSCQALYVQPVLIQIFRPDVEDYIAPLLDLAKVKRNKGKFVVSNGLNVTLLNRLRYISSFSARGY